MCELVYPHTSRTARVACARSINTEYKNSHGYFHKKGNDVQVEGFNPGEIFQRERGLDQNIDQSHGQVTITEEPNNTQGGYLQLYLIPYPQS